MTEIGSRIRLEEIARMAELAANLWGAVALAADRGDTTALNVHVNQIVILTRAAIAAIREEDTWTFRKAPREEATYERAT
jgi:hypothetical protein